jgi:hypothetical protein
VTALPWRMSCNPPTTYPPIRTEVLGVTHTMPRRRLLSGQQLVLEIKRLNKNKQQQTSAKNH